jgi:integrase
MGRKVPPGLIKRGNIWHVAKTIAGKRVRETCGTNNLVDAERYLANRIVEIRNTEVYGLRPKRTFRQAVTHYVNQCEKRSLPKDMWGLKRIDPFIGDLYLHNIHMGTLGPYIEHGKKQGWKNRTINRPLEVVRHILNLAAGEWIDEHGLTWLSSAPKIRLLPLTDAREPYPLSWKEQEALFSVLPDHIRRMCLFAVNTGLRNGEVCGLSWNDEVEIPELETSVFIIPKERIKNWEDRLVVLNSIARQVIEEVRGEHPTWVFTYQGHRLKSMRRTAWINARHKVGLDFVRIHDLRHTYGRRLRSAGVSFEDRQDLLGHKSGRITTHYSAPELINLMEASERVCVPNRHKSDTVVMLKKKTVLSLVSGRAG